jgi:putative transposase
MILSYRYRIQPNKAQEIALTEMLCDFCALYNGALEHRISAYKRGISIKCNEQIVTLPEIRRDLPHQGRWSATAQQQVLRKLDKTYKAFFARVKRGQTPGFPRFRACDRYHAADFRVGDGMTIRTSGKLTFVGVPGEIKVRWHREMPSKSKSCILSRNADKWFIIFHVDVAPTERASPDVVGLDMGLTSFVAQSNGEIVKRPNFTKRHAAKLRRLQRALARCKRGSNVHRKRKATIARHHAYIANSRRDFLHKNARKIVNRFGRIAVEALNIKGLASGILAKSVNDASWGQFVSFIRYKAESAGCELIEVDPRGTSRECPKCHAIAAKTLAERTHRCPCGCVLDRDVAAATIVHYRAFGFVPGAGSGLLTWPATA